MKVSERRVVAGVTVIVTDSDLPSGEWGKLVIDGTPYEPLRIMDATANNIIAVKDHHDFDGKEMSVL